MTDMTTTTIDGGVVVRLPGKDGPVSVITWVVVSMGIYGLVVRVLFCVYFYIYMAHIHPLTLFRIPPPDERGCARNDDHLRAYGSVFGGANSKMFPHIWKRKSHSMVCWVIGEGQTSSDRSEFSGG
jgi:hypothetical protein